MVVIHILASIAVAMAQRFELSFWISILCATPCIIIFLLLLLIRPRSVPETFKAPLVPFTPLVGMFVNIYIIGQLPFDAIIRVLVWTGFGLLIYTVYGIRHSKLNFYRTKAGVHTYETIDEPDNGSVNVKLGHSKK